MYVALTNFLFKNITGKKSMISWILEREAFRRKKYKKHHYPLKSKMYTLERKGKNNKNYRLLHKIGKCFRCCYRHSRYLSNDNLNLEVITLKNKNASFFFLFQLPFVLPFYFLFTK